MHGIKVSHFSLVYLRKYEKTAVDVWYPAAKALAAAEKELLEICERGFENHDKYFLMKGRTE